MFGFMSRYYVLTCHVLHHESAKKNRTALSLIKQAWRRDELAPATRHGDAGPLQSLWLSKKFNYTLKGTGNACGQNGAQSQSHPSQWECVTFAWTLNGVCYSRQAVPVGVMCMFNPPPSPFLFLLLPLFSHLDCVSPTACSAELVYICVGENPRWSGLAATCTAIKGGKK